MLKQEQISDILLQFIPDGCLIAFEQITTGHINETYRVVWATEKQTQVYMLSGINPYVFPDADKLMKNIQLVVSELKKSPDVKETLYFLKTKTGQFTYPSSNEKGQAIHWRLAPFFEGTISGSTALLRDAIAGRFQIGQAYGRFSFALKEVDPMRMVEPIKDFHNYDLRMKMLDLRWDQKEHHEKYEVHVYETLKEIYYGVVVPFLAKTENCIKRVIHSDAKPDNVLFHSQDDSARVVIDYDTCMAGCLWQDFGDLVRSCACEISYCGVSNCEQELHFEANYNHVWFRSLYRGFLDAWQRQITQEELESLRLSGCVLACILGIRYFDDYLDNNRYFKIQGPYDNIHKAQKQIAICKAIIEHQGDILEEEECYLQEK